jgi:hypothetical protein
MVQTQIPTSALSARASGRVEALSTPKNRPDGLFREPQWPVSIVNDFLTDEYLVTVTRKIMAEVAHFFTTCPFSSRPGIMRHSVKLYGLYLEKFALTETAGYSAWSVLESPNFVCAMSPMISQSWGYYVISNMTY